MTFRSLASSWVFCFACSTIAAFTRSLVCFARLWITFSHAWLSSLVAGSGSDGCRDSESVSATTFTILVAASVNMAAMPTAGSAAEAVECPLSGGFFSILFTCSRHFLLHNQIRSALCVVTYWAFVSLRHLAHFRLHHTSHSRILSVSSLNVILQTVHTQSSYDSNVLGFLLSTATPYSAILFSIVWPVSGKLHKCFTYMAGFALAWFLFPIVCLLRCARV